MFISVGKEEKINVTLNSYLFFKQQQISAGGQWVCWPSCGGGWVLVSRQVKMYRYHWLANVRHFILLCMLIPHCRNKAQHWLLFWLVWIDNDWLISCATCQNGPDFRVFQGILGLMKEKNHLTQSDPWPHYHKRQALSLACLHSDKSSSNEFTFYGVITKILYAVASKEPWPVWTYVVMFSPY